MDSTPSTPAGSPPDRDKYFYTAAAVLMLVLVVLGFRLFYAHGQAFPGRPLTPPIRQRVIQHGIAMSAWIILLVIQPLLIVNRRYKLHMTLGKLGAVLAAVIVVLGIRVALGAASVNPPDLKIWGLVPRQFLTVQLHAVVFFAGFVAVGVWYRQRPAIHKPMMFFATLTAVAAAIDRIDWITRFYADTALGACFGPYLAPTGIAIVLLLVKWALTRAFDRVFALGCLLLAISGPVVLKLATTSAWDKFAGLLLG